MKNLTQDIKMQLRKINTGFNEVNKLVTTLSPGETKALASSLIKLSDQVVDELTLYRMRHQIADEMRSALSCKTVTEIESFVENEQLLVHEINNWPVDMINMVPTPAGKDAPLKDIVLATMIQVGLSELRNRPVLSYPSENNGQLIRHVTQKYAKQNQLSSHGGATNLPWHSDVAHRPIAGVEATELVGAGPEHLTLFANRVIHGTPTMFLPVSDIFESFSESEQEELLGNNFVIYPPESFSSEGASKHKPIFVRKEDKVWMRYGGRIEAEEQKFDATLTKLKLILAKLEGTPQFMLPGTSVTWKQNRILHARSIIPAQFNGAGRWYLRLYSASVDGIVPSHPEVPFLSR
ncbi:hypothetical protein ACD631_16325 [Alteromonas macleodii]|uniref:hypothetical protein n=1 Tax=Alteromonas macleodii TaxID=28108 RepID=UPI00207669E9|nr:hypothetical protein [Alteromonas macleodii]USI27922.1 hypothetical protein NFG60_19805 [Alteromonas macleodii]